MANDQSELYNESALFQDLFENYIGFEAWQVVLIFN